jgi:hypothetical protein
MLLSSLLSSVLYTKFRRFIARGRSSTRSLVTLSFALIAPAVGFATAIVYLFPESAQLLVFPHCHGAECGTHVPLVTVSSLGSIVLLAATSLLLFGLIGGLTRLLVTGRRRLATLFLLGDRIGGAPDHLVVDSDQSFAWCCGLLDQRLVLSSKLVEQLSPVQLQAVLAHEREHASRFDNLRNLTARLASVFWLPSRRRRLIDDLLDDAEECCDAAAWTQIAETSPLRQAYQKRTSELLGTWSAAKPALKEHGGNAGTEPSCIALVSRPLVAYLVLGAVWTFQLMAVVAVSHPIVEVVSALGG